MAGKIFSMQSNMINNNGQQCDTGLVTFNTRLTLVRAIVAFFLMLLLNNTLLGQSVGDYRTNGNVQFNLVANWQTYDGAAWVAAATDPGLGSGAITVRNGHTATLTSSETLDHLIIEAGGALRVNSSRTLTISDGAEAFDLDVYGLVDNYWAITPNAGAVIRFNANSTYNHRLNGGAITTATWDITSTCNILEITNTVPTGLAQTFGNFTWNCPNQNSDIDLNSNLSINGTFTMSNTGTRYLRIATTGSYSVNLGGFAQTGGRLNLAIGGFSCTFNLSGGFTFSGGNFLTSGSGIGNVNFVGPGLQVFNRTGGAFSNTKLNYTVHSGAILNMGTSIIDVSGTYVASGTFTLNAGGGLMLGDPYGITLTTTGATGGNIRVLGTRTFSSGADYTYSGTVPQVTGDGLPVTVRNFTVNNSAGVTLTDNLDVTGLLTMTTGNIIPDTHNLLLSNTAATSLAYSSGTIVGSFERHIGSTLQDYFFPVGTSIQTQGLTANFSDLVSGSLLVNFVSGDPGNAGLPLTDAGSYFITNQYTTGYWFAQAKNSLATSSYQIDLDATGFGPYPITAGTRIIRRTGASDWELDGSHGGVAGAIVSRSGMTAGISSLVGGTNFCIGKTGPIITSQPSDAIICQGSTDASVFSVTATGYGTLTYQWYKSPSTMLSNDGHYTGTTSSTLGITNAVSDDSGGYYCIVTDGRGELIQSSSANLSVPKVTFGYNYYVDITIDQASGSEDLTDFPVLINITQDYLRSLANGGHVENPNGYDILFTDLNGSKLNHQVEAYYPVTGNLVAWVRVPILSGSGTTVVRMIYGNQAVTTDQSVETTWISSYKGVWHLSNDVFLDATSYSNDVANNGTSDISGLIEEARSFDGSNDNLRTLSTTGFGGNAYNQTISVWARYAALPASTQNLIDLQRAGSPSAVQLGIREVGGVFRVVVWNWGGSPLVWSNLPSAGVWHFYSYTYDGTNHRLFIDGVEAATSTTAQNQTAIPQYLYFGSYSGGEYFNGILDEGRYSLSYKTPGRIATEYINQIIPGDFISVGSENELNDLTSLGVCNDPVTLQGFPAGGTFSGTGVTGNLFDPEVAGPGTHSITYSNSISGCAVSVSKNIQVTPGPIAPLAENKYCCIRNVVDLEAAGTNIRWYTDAGLTTMVGWGTPFATGRTATGTYTYYVTQTVNGCESPATTLTLTIYPNTPVSGTATVNRTPSCIGNTVIFNLTGYTGYIARWEKKLSTETVWNTIPGTENQSSFSELVSTAGTWNYRTVVTVGLCGTVYANVNLDVIADIVGPEISGCPSGITVYTGVGNTTCAQTATWTEPTSIDYCEGTVAYASRSHAPGSTFPVGTTIVTYTFTDSKANSSVCNFDITVIDNTSPTWTTAAGNLDRTVSCSDAAALTAAQALAPVATDNCDVTLAPAKTPGAFVAGTCPQAGTYTNTWTVSDDYGNAVVAVYTQTITITDNTAPTWTTVAGNLDRTIECSDAAALTAAQVLAPVATDNCDVTLAPAKTPGAFVAGTCPQAGTYTNTWTVSDDCGNAVVAVYTQTITITDNTAPTWTTAAGSLDRTVACSDAAALTAAQVLAPVASDNCDITLTPVKTAGLFVAGTCPQAGTYTNTWTVSDDCGNAVVAVYTQTITITDNTAPTWTTAAGSLDRTVACSDAAALTAAQVLVPVASDNCDITLTPVKTAGLFVAGTCPQAGTYTNTWTVSDDCGNAVVAVYTQTITITDNTAPTWTTAAGNLDRTVACSDAAALTAAQVLAPVASDNCDVTLAPVKTPGAFVAGTCPQAGTYTNTWTVSDDCGNAVVTVYTQTITITDNTAPTWTTAAGNVDRTLECSDAAGLAAAQAMFPVATDNCDTDVTNIVKVSGAYIPGAVCPEAGSYTNTWTVTDACGNVSAVYTQTITIIDTTAPAWITLPAALDVTLECNDAAGLAAAQAMFPVATDNCDTDVINIVKVPGAYIPGALCPEAGSYTNTWTVTDACGNVSAVYTQTITIVDTTPPTWTTLPAALDVTLECSDAVGLAAAQAMFPVATDNCDTDVTNIVKVFGAYIPGALCPEAGSYTNTWTVTDACGNVSAVYTQTITIIDTTAPTWTTLPAALDVTLECNDAAGLAATQAMFPVATDNCDPDVTNIIKTFVGLVNTWTVTDACGNVSEVYTQTITIEDTTPPTWTTLPAALDVTLECGDVAGLAAAQVMFPAATDNCDTDVTNIVKTAGVYIAGITCPEAGSYTNTWIVSDDSGNTSLIYTQTITIIDTTSPTWTTAAGTLDVTLECSDVTGLAAAQALFPAATDNCDTDVTNIVKVSGAYIPGALCPEAGSYTNTWTVTDACGNVSAVYTQTITIVDTTAPTWTTVANALDVTLECSDVAGLATAQAMFPVATDNCDTDVTNIVKVSGAYIPGALCPEAGSYTNTWTVTDGCGNVSAVYTQTITIIDTTAPTWTTLPAALDVTLECNDAAGLAAAQAMFPVATDNCDPDVTNIIKTSVGLVNTWTVTDACGNVSEVYTQTITIVDTTPPTWTTLPAALDVTLECSDAAGLAAAQAMFPAATDNCDTDVTNIVKTAGVYIAGITCPEAGSYTNTWIVSDDSGNTSLIYTQTITIIDTTSPTWTTLPTALDVTLECNDAAGLAAAQALFPAATDNCDTDVTNIVKVPGAYIAGALCPEAGSYTNTWTVTDACGNVSAVYTQTITIIDTTAPTWTTAVNVLDVTLECSDVAGLAAAQAMFPVATDNCDTDVTNIVKVSGAYIPGALCPEAGSYTNTWTVPDACGNVSAVYTQTITIIDTTSPTWTTAVNALDVTLECSDVAGLAAAQAIFPVATDNCDTDVTNIVKVSGAYIPGALCPESGSYTNTWTVTDACGNVSAVYTQTITIIDTTSPAWITLPAALDVTLECSDAAGLAAAQAMFPVATDNCDTDVTNIVKVSGAYIPGALCPEAGSYTNTWTVTDACGNVSAVYTQTITIIDITAPTWTTLPAALDVTLECNDAAGLAAAQAMFPVATDNCDTDVTNIVKVSGAYIPGAVCPEAGSYTNTWTVTDACGNVSAVYTQTITIIDTTAPTFTVPDDITICRDLTGAYDRDVANTGDVTDEADNCDTTLDAAYSDSDVAMGTVTVVGYITRTWTLADDCGNTTVQYQTIWVQPVPHISVEVPDTLFCNGSTVNFTIDSLVVSRGEVMYNLDVTYPGPVTGTLTDGSRQILDISDLLTNNSDSHQTVTYRFSPYIQGKPGDPTCNAGIDTTIVIHLEPTAKVSTNLANDELCNGEIVNISLSTVTVPYRGIEFNVDAQNNDPEISGYTDRTGLIVTDIITEPLTNSGDTARLVLYVISPVTLDVLGIQKCFGINDTVEVWVNPTPRVIPVNEATRICDQGITNVTLTSPSVMTSGVIEFNYIITVTAPPAIVAGNRASAFSQLEGTQLQFNYTNESDTMQSVFFRIVPKVVGLSCPYGDSVITEVKIHPRPLRELEIRDSITCDGGQDGTLEVIHARGLDPLWVAWTGPDFWEAAGNNMFIVSERRQGYYTARVTDSLGCTNSDFLNLTEPSTEVSFYFDNFISCPGANDARIGLALTDGQAPPYYYYIVWNMTDTLYQGSLPPMDSPPDFIYIDDVKPGEYLLIVEDGNGCKETELRMLHDAASATVSLTKSQYSGYNISCEGYDDGSLWVSRIQSYYIDYSASEPDTVFVARGPYTYQWTTTDGMIPGSTTDSIIVGITAGTYDLTVTDVNGCVFHFSDTMSEPDGIDLISESLSHTTYGSFNITCFGRNDGFINLEFDGGAGAYTYDWYEYPAGAITNTTAEDQTGLIAGMYRLRVTDANSCHKVYNWDLAEPDSVGITVITSKTGDLLYEIGCNGADGWIDITVTGGAETEPYGYLWKGVTNPAYESTTEDQTAIKAGVYRVYVTDANGCMTDRGLSLSEPLPLDLTLSVSDITCLTAPAYNDGVIDLTVTGGKNPYGYAWTGPSGYTAVVQDISSLPEGSYSMTVTDDYGCQAVIDTVLTLPPSLTIDTLISNYNGFNVRCLGYSDGWLKVIPLTGVPPYNYSWTGPDGFTNTTDSIFGLKEGTYIVTVTDGHNCVLTEPTSLVSSGQISMVLDIGLSNGGANNINCIGAATGRINITPVNAAGTSSYLWSDGGTGASRTDLRAGNNEVIITDANGCSADTLMTLTEPDSLLITFTWVDPFCPESTDAGITADVTGGEEGYNFEWNNGMSSAEITGLMAGLYKVVVTDFNGCTVTDSLTLAPVNEICVGIPNIFSPDGDGINELWNITRIALYPEAEVIVMNRWGEMVWKSEKGYPEPWDGRASNGKVLPMDSYHYAIDLHNGEKPIVGHISIVR